MKDEKAAMSMTVLLKGCLYMMRVTASSSTWEYCQYVLAGASFVLAEV